ncbi:MAG: dienelactone hydrolase family protein [Planctomycetota bacterium]|nr:dienelactone hydrolase family protein [Planctomycetota bacterium]
MIWRACRVTLRARILNISPLQAELPGFRAAAADIEVDGGRLSIPFLTFLPDGPDASGSGRPPLLMFLHGMGERGTDMKGLRVHGPVPAIEKDGGFRSWFPFVGLFPQCPPDARWEHPPMTAAALALLEWAIVESGADPGRVYCTGFSMGGIGTWSLALAAPDLFAAIAPISAKALEPELARARLSHLPVWIVVGENDGPYTEGSLIMAKALEGSCPRPILTVVPGEGHLVCRLYYGDVGFYRWFLGHARPAGPARHDAGAAPPSGKKDRLP